MIKEMEDYFVDWYNHVFEFRHASASILVALKNFLSSYNHGFDYEKISDKMHTSTLDLLINTLCQNDILEPGISTNSKYIWPTDQGFRLMAFLLSYGAYELHKIIMTNSNHRCSPDICFCFDPTSSISRCNNPFWTNKEQIDY